MASALKGLSRKPRIVVAGGGIGGLVAALESAAAGAEVSLFERSSHIGGKIFSAEISGRKIDMGPTVLTMRWVFDTIFQDVGLDLNTEVSLIRADIIARHAWEDGSSLDLFCDEESSRQAVADFAGPGQADAYVSFSRYAKKIYEHAYRTFLISKSPALRDMAASAGLGGLISVFHIDPFRRMNKAIGAFFTDRRLIQLFSRYATYYGASPYLSPATLNLIAEVERQGVFLPKDGISSLSDAVRKAAESFGAAIHTNVGVYKIHVENGRVRGVVTDDERFIPADAVVFNGDAAAVAAGALGEAVRPAVKARALSDRSLSAVVTAFIGRTKGFSLRSHNVFFPDMDYQREFDDIFRLRRMPSCPALYIRAQDRDEGAAPVEGERLFTIMNAPPLIDGVPLSDTEMDKCIEATQTLLNRIGLHITKESEERRMSPVDFSNRFPETNGAIYGRAMHSPFAALKREGARTKISGLYLAGGSIHPGAGVPMAALSGRQAATAVLSDLGLKGPCPLPDTPGGTSTA